MNKAVDVASVYTAVQVCMNQCVSAEQLQTAGNCVIEMLTAIEFNDGEIIDALRGAQGLWSVADDYIDEMIERIKG